jgi:hypothetical protein
MAKDAVGICNDALIILGAETIQSLDQASSTEANLCNLRYEGVRDKVLESFPWACTLTRVALARSSAAPLFGYAYRYALPNDCLKVVSMKYQDQYDWREVSGRMLETDCDTCTIQYIARVTDVPKMSPLLQWAISTQLAAVIAYKLTSSKSDRDYAENLHDKAMAEAATNDAGRQSIIQPTSDTWLDAR